MTEKRALEGKTRLHYQHAKFLRLLSEKSNPTPIILAQNILAAAIAMESNMRKTAGPSKFRAKFVIGAKNRNFGKVVFLW